MASMLIAYNKHNNSKAVTLGNLLFIFDFNQGNVFATRIDTAANSQDFRRDMALFGFTPSRFSDTFVKPFSLSTYFEVAAIGLNLRGSFRKVERIANIIANKNFYRARLR